MGGVRRKPEAKVENMTSEAAYQTDMVGRIFTKYWREQGRRLTESQLDAELKVLTIRDGFQPSFGKLTLERVAPLLARFEKEGHIKVNDDVITLLWHGFS